MIETRIIEVTPDGVARISGSATKFPIIVSLFILFLLDIRIV